MKVFDVYQLQLAPGGTTGGVEVVKRGFSWPGLFFGGLWALSKHLWLHGVLLILIVVPLNLTTLYAAEEGLVWLRALTMLAVLGVCIVVGQNGNEWRRRRLVQAGFRTRAVVEAGNVEEALALAAAEDEGIAIAQAAPGSKRSYSVGGLVVAGILLLSSVSSIASMSRMAGPFLLSVFLAVAVPGVALAIRSFRPPVGFLRGLAVVFGGMCLGLSTRLIEMSLLLPDYDEQMVDLVFFAVGVGLLWIGFKPVKAKVEETASVSEA
jgi:hypothetical protein